MWFVSAEIFCAVLASSSPEYLFFIFSTILVFFFQSSDREDLSFKHIAPWIFYSCRSFKESSRGVGFDGRFETTQLFLVDLSIYPENSPVLGADETEGFATFSTGLCFIYDDFR